MQKEHYTISVSLPPAKLTSSHDGFELPIDFGKVHILLVNTSIAKVVSYSHLLPTYFSFAKTLSFCVSS